MFYRLVLLILTSYLTTGIVSAGVMHSGHVDGCDLESVAVLLSASGDDSVPAVQNVRDCEMAQHDLLSGSSLSLAATIACRMAGLISPEMSGTRGLFSSGAARDPWLVTVLKPS
ncbi:hypothetical protein LOC67_13015 [Stieleria sp. JC731]|uniref:hypothetical protein n=1 Tax=Pirellulaceae TaxID=2691357 RepID=UPI001E33C96A|nr:hypothetical protein [Stieleria sp. JC731]MCC9601470.1 hypothetical protein [Stieleria sp. JC731]